MNDKDDDDMNSGSGSSAGFSYAREDPDTGEMQVLGPMMDIDLMEMLERTQDEDGNGHMDVPDWWALESGYWVAFQAGVITHMSGDGVGTHLVLGFGYPSYGQEGEPRVLIKTVSFRDDEQIAMVLGGMFGSLAELGGIWQKRMEIIEHAIATAMQEGEW